MAANGSPLMHNNETGLLPGAFTLTLKVRDYECDIQGIVNNAVYLSYLEHTRHEYILSKGVDFNALTSRGILLVVSSIQIHYLVPLRSGDEFTVFLNAAKTGPQLVCHQEIVRQSDNKLCTRADVHIACSVDGKLTKGDFFDILL